MLYMVQVLIQATLFLLDLYFFCQLAEIKTNYKQKRGMEILMQIISFYEVPS
jgi:hypothetical protein